MTLTEFLLARIAEDKAYALHYSEHWTNCLAPKGGECTCIATLGRRNRRRMAECESKRRIVDDYAAEFWLLRLLALPYADHPDYREEWRP